MSAYIFNSLLSLVQHTNTDDIELESALDKLPLDLLGDAVEANVAFGVHRLRLLLLLLVLLLLCVCCGHSCERYENKDSMRNGCGSL